MKIFVVFPMLNRVFMPAVAFSTKRQVLDYIQATKRSDVPLRDPDRYKAAVRQWLEDDAGAPPRLIVTDYDHYAIHDVELTTP